MSSSHFLRPLLGPEGAAGRTMRKIGGTGVLARTIEVAGDSEARKRGLLGRDRLPAETALVIAPCGGVHTFGMRFRIDVIFVARDGLVLKIAHDLGPRRIAVAWRAFAAVETAAGEAARHGLKAGDRLEVG